MDQYGVITAGELSLPLRGALAPQFAAGPLRGQGCCCCGRLGTAGVPVLGVDMARLSSWPLNAAGKSYVSPLNLMIPSTSYETLDVVPFAGTGGPFVSITESFDAYPVEPWTHSSGLFQMASAAYIHRFV